MARHRLMFHRTGTFGSGNAGLPCALAAFEVPGLDLPHFAVHPRRIGACRLHDLQAEQVPQFLDEANGVLRLFRL